MELELKHPTTMYKIFALIGGSINGLGLVMIFTGKNPGVGIIAVILGAAGLAISLSLEKRYR